MEEKVNEPKSEATPKPSNYFSSSCEDDDDDVIEEEEEEEEEVMELDDGDEEEEDGDVVVLSQEQNKTIDSSSTTRRRYNKKPVIPGERKSTRLKSKISFTFSQKKQESVLLKSLVVIMKKPAESLTEEEKTKLLHYPKLTKVAKKRLQKSSVAKDRLREIEDPENELNEKCSLLADIIKNSKYLMIYTGAGISTSARIPDYRGPNGIWTMLQKGQSLETHTSNMNLLTTADPTKTHMAIYELYKRGIVKHIVSQNCDGLHLRSGVPKVALSEVHGNMYIEVCVKCNREYVRVFDVTEFSRRREHRTGRQCYHCNSALKDSIVHFGERGSLRWPLNWAGAEYNCNHADTIICLGSSLKVLRRYPWLWSMYKPANKRPVLCIVNLQWTPKDQFARLKIHGRTDEVMTKVMEKLQIPIPEYHRSSDPIFNIATPLHESELSTKSAVDLIPAEGVVPTKSVDLNNYIRFDSSKAREVIKLNSDQNTASVIKKGTFLKMSGTGWLGNAWGVKPKAKKKSQKTSTTREESL